MRILLRGGKEELAPGGHGQGDEKQAGHDESAYSPEAKFPPVDRMCAGSEMKNGEPHETGGTRQKLVTKVTGHRRQNQNAMPQSRGRFKGVGAAIAKRRNSDSALAAI